MGLAQTAADPAISGDRRSVEIKMSDGVKVLVVILIIWVGIFLYLMKLDGEVRRLKRGQRDG